MDLAYDEMNLAYAEMNLANAEINLQNNYDLDSSPTFMYKLN